MSRFDDASIRAELDILMERVLILYDDARRDNGLQHLDEAIESMQQAVELTDADTKPSMSGGLGILLQTRFERTAAIDDLRRAVDATTTAAEQVSRAHPHQALLYTHLGLQRGQLFKKTDTVSELVGAVKAFLTATESTLPSDSDFSRRCCDLSIWFRELFDRTNTTDGLDPVIDALERAVESAPRNDPLLVVNYHNLSTFLGIRFERVDEEKDMDDSVSAALLSVNYCSGDNALALARYLDNLGNQLKNRYRRRGVLQDVDEAVTAATRALELTSKTSEDFARFSNNLAVSLALRFDKTEEMEDLEQAIAAATKAVEATPEEHPNFADFCNSLGSLRGKQFAVTGVVNYLKLAIEMSMKSVRCMPQGTDRFASASLNLGNTLGRYYQRTGSIDSLNSAIDVLTTALDVAPQESYNIGASLNSLANCLGMRFERTGIMQDIDHAIKVAAEAVDATPGDHPNLVAYYSALGSSLSTRYQRTGSMSDIDKAVEAMTKAVQSTPQGHPNFALYWNNLGGQLAVRSERPDAVDPIKDLNHAIDGLANAVKSTPSSHPHLCWRLIMLGRCLQDRFRRLGAAQDQDDQLSHLNTAWGCVAAPPSMRIKAAKAAAGIYIKRREWGEASRLLHDAVLLLPNVTLRSLEHTDMQSLLAPQYGLARLAASTALSAGKLPWEALRLLELGRGVIAGLVMDLRADISELSRADSLVAEKLASLRNELESGSDDQRRQSATSKTSSSPPWQVQQERQQKRDQADRELSLLIEKTRMLPGFANFLQPLTKEEMMGMASHGPMIVINMTPTRSDAFLVVEHGIRSIELPRLKELEAAKQADDLPHMSDLTELLAWLWDAVCRPCLDALGFTAPVTNGIYARVFWIPTGSLSYLPLHAAGLYGQGSRETVMDRVMSSYALSIKALFHGRRRSRPRATTPGNGTTTGSALLVAMEQTSGQSNLPYAREEVRMLAGLCPLLHLDTPSLRPQRDEILLHFKHCTIFHFAGHGVSHRDDPSQSSLLLDQPLTVQDLRDSRLQDNPPFLAYLSACSTGVSKNGELSDEGIHLVSTFQLAGFRHAIGTLWEVSDSHCVNIAKVVYETLRDDGMTDAAVCRGLHQALLQMRGALLDRQPSKREGREEGERDVELVSSEGQRQGTRSWLWVPYIHYGA